MTFEDLKDFIFRTRQAEGVAWYFADLSTGNSRLAEIHCFNTDGSKTATIVDIKPNPDGHIDRSVLAVIADARSLCGPANAFLSKRRSASQNPSDAYFAAFNEWLTTGKRLFTDGDVSAQPA